MPNLDLEALTLDTLRSTRSPDIASPTCHTDEMLAAAQTHIYAGTSTDSQFRVTPDGGS
jgi:hypothetical protein